MTQGIFARILRRYGQDVTVYTQNFPNGTTVQAFFQPVRDKGTRQCVPSPLGTVYQDRFVYLGPAEPALEDACILRGPIGTFRAQAVQPIRVGGQLNHWWGIFTRREGDAAQ